jgi:8-oxo-dGTP diphosphatase
LRLLRALPPSMRERVVRTGAPGYVLGAACLVEHDGRALVVQTAYRPGWGLPGGLLSRGETPDVGAKREVHEEVGLVVELGARPVVVIDAAPRLVDFLFRATLAAGMSPDDAHAASVEITEIEWIAADAVTERIAGTAGHLVHKVQLFDRHPEGGLVFLDASGRATGPPV